MRKSVLIGVAMLIVAITVICAADAWKATTQPANAALEKRLAEWMDCNFNKTAFGDVIVFMQHATLLPLVVDKRAMTEAGINDKDPVTLRATNITRRQCLDAIAKAISKPGHTIVAGVVGNVVMITSPAWLEKSIKQERADAAKVGKDDVAQLNRNLPDVSFNKIQLSDVVDFLSDVTGAEIKVNWDDLKASGVARDVPIDLRLSAVPLREVLRAVLDQASGRARKTRAISISRSGPMA